MKQYLAIVIYRCLVAGEPDDVLDVQVRFYLAESEEEVRKRVVEEENHSYENPDGERVEWELREIMAVEEFLSPESGDEVVGFIAEVDEFVMLA